MMSLFKKYYYSFQIDNNLSQIFQDNIRAFVFFRKDFNLLKYEDLGMILFSLNNNVSCFMIFYGSNDCVRYQVIFWIYEIKQRFLRSLSGYGRLRYSPAQIQTITGLDRLILAHLTADSYLIYKLIWSVDAGPRLELRKVWHFSPCGVFGYVRFSLRWWCLSVFRSVCCCD